MIAEDEEIPCRCSWCGDTACICADHDECSDNEYWFAHCMGDCDNKINMTCPTKAEAIKQWNIHNRKFDSQKEQY